MVLKDEFKKAIQAGNLNEALILAMSQATELNITTWVAPESGEMSSTPQPGNRLHAHIDLVQGKIENEIGDRFIGYGPYRELRDFHQQQVARSHAFVRDNLQSLQKLFGALSAIQQQNQHLAARDAGLPPLELPPLPQLHSSQPNSSASPASVIPTLEPLAPLPNFAEKPSPTPEPPKTEKTVSPTPVMPVSELEIEDWEEAVAGASSPQSSLTTSEKLEQEPEEAIATSPGDNAAVEGDWSGFRAISGEDPPAESVGGSIEPTSAIAPESFPEEHWSPSLEDPSQSRVEEIFFEKDDWGDPLGNSSVSAAALLNGSNETELRQQEWENLIPEDSSDSALIESSEPETPETFLEESEDWDDFNPEEALGSTLTEPLEQRRPEEARSDDEDRGDFTEMAPPKLITVDPENTFYEVNFNRGDWDDLISEEPPDSTLTESLEIEETETFLEEDENWRDFNPKESLNSTLTEPVESEASEAFLDDEDWGELTEVYPPNLIATDTPTPEILPEEEEDWDEFVVGDSSNEAFSENTEMPTPENSLEEEEDWDEFVVGDSSNEVFSENTEMPTPENSLEEEEDWDEFVVGDSSNEDLPESPEMPTPEIFSEEEEDWGEFIPEDSSSADFSESPEIPPLENSLEAEEDWDEFVVGDSSNEDLPESPEMPTPEVFSEEEEDWGEFIPEDSSNEDFLESPKTPRLENSLEEEEDWGEIVVGDSSNADFSESPEMPTPEIFSEKEEDWGEFETEELENSSESELTNRPRESQIFPANGLGEETPDESPDSVTIESADLFPETELADDDWGDFTEEELDDDPSIPDLRTVHLAAESEIDEHEDWGEFTEEELDAEPSVPDLRAHFREIDQLESQEEDEWGGLIEEEGNSESAVFKEEANAESAIPDFSVTNVGNDSEWEEFESLDPFMSPMESEPSLTSIELEENWDDFSAEELEPYPNASDLTSDREFGSIEEESHPAPLPSRGSHEAIAIPPSPTADDSESFDLEDLGFEEVDLEDTASEPTFPSDEDLFSETTTFQQQASPESPENPSRSQ
jgi:hypothetical protein